MRFALLTEVMRKSDVLWQGCCHFLAPMQPGVEGELSLLGYLTNDILVAARLGRTATNVGRAQ